MGLHLNGEDVNAFCIGRVVRQQESRAALDLLHTEGYRFSCTHMMTWVSDNHCSHSRIIRSPVKVPLPSGLSLMGSMRIPPLSSSLYHEYAVSGSDLRPISGNRPLLR